MLTVHLAGGGGGGWVLRSAQLVIVAADLDAATRLTPAEAATAARIDRERAESTGGGGGGDDAAAAAWVGSGGWARARFRAHFSQLASTAAAQLLAGNSAELCAMCGEGWVRRWAATRSFGAWAARNGLGAAARLWRARTQLPEPAPADAPADAPVRVAAEAVRGVGAKVRSWTLGALGELRGAPAPGPGAAGVVTGCSSRPPFDYVGETRRGAPHGRGVGYRDVEGAVYVGTWRDGKEHGAGAELRAPAAADTAAWRRRRAAGVGGVGGSFRSAESALATAAWASERAASPGCIYRGAWADGRRHGGGVHVAVGSGWSVAGSWVDGCVEGEAAACHVDGGRLLKFEGTWRDGEPEGFGREERRHVDVRSDSDGGDGALIERYEGEWAGGVRSGVGRLWLAGGAWYVGGFVNDMAHGHGCLMGGDDRALFDGAWEKGVPQADAAVVAAVAAAWPSRRGAAASADAMAAAVPKTPPAAAASASGLGAAPTTAPATPAVAPPASDETGGRMAAVKIFASPEAQEGAGAASAASPAVVRISLMGSPGDEEADAALRAAALRQHYEQLQSQKRTGSRRRRPGSARRLPAA